MRNAELFGQTWDRCYLDDAALRELRRAHQRASGKREAYRINAAILLGSGWSAEDVAEALLISADAARSDFMRYRERGITALLDSRDSASNNAEFVNCSADPVAHGSFLEILEKLKKTKAGHDRIYLVNATCSQRDHALAYGDATWLTGREIPTGNGTQRANINTAIDLESFEPIVRFDDRMNAAATIALFRQIELANPQAERILIICDKTCCYESKEVRGYLETSKIQLIFLPPCALDRNPTEGF